MMMTRNYTALLLALSVIQLTSVAAFSPTRMIQNRQASHSVLKNPTSERSSLSLYNATSYDQDEGFTSAEEREISTEEKKERVSQIMVVAVGAFFTYSIIMVAMSTASFVGGSMSEAFDIGNIFNFAGSVVGTVAGATWTGLKVAAPVVGKGVVSAGQAAAPYVQEASQKVSEVATPYVQEAAQKVSEAASPVVEQAALAVNEAASKVSEAASPVVEQAAQAVNEAASPYISAVDSTINSAASAVTSTIDATVVAPLKEATDSVVSTVDSTVKATTDSVVTAVDSSIKGAAGSVSSTLKGVTDGAVESIKQVSPF